MTPSKAGAVGFRQIFALRWKPTINLLAVAISWILVVGALYAATNIIGAQILVGMGYFLTYAVLAALIFGFCFPILWMFFIRKRSIQAVGITSRNLGWSIAIQLIATAVQAVLARNSLYIPKLSAFVPLLSLSLCIGLFEAVFWRGWVQLRIEEAFGTIPGILLGSILYALYHIGYGMPWSEIGFLFFIGLMFAVIFRITCNVFILWPIFQPFGQLMTLTKDKLELPLIATVGFVEVLLAMIVIAIVVNRIAKKRKYSE